ncbi:hypothetical protein CHS0354_003693 [Potamilus streckersoni]|uniref:Uncharacterized protein n=1 Tax=Potamilus streckersoni TaxID=2493646 RepID=A0AAE0W080_9BIVA|nr:hypothetical protein CHS0354_003693 [Potamilus streckersoni]
MEYPHPIAPRPPKKHPVRSQVEKNTFPRGKDGKQVCSCFPDPSHITIPSMFYDGIKCHHEHENHIQPAQQMVFAYPWTADSVGRKRARGEEGETSLIEEGYGSHFQARKNLEPDQLSTMTAPPFRSQSPNLERTNPPFTAPNKTTNFQIWKNKRWDSLGDLQERNYRANKFDQRYGDAEMPSKYNRNTVDPERQFTGSYVDPKDGKVYSYNVNYRKQSIEATRKPQPRPTPTA